MVTRRKLNRRANERKGGSRLRKFKWEPRRGMHNSRFHIELPLFGPFFKITRPRRVISGAVRITVSGRANSCREERANYLLIIPNVIHGSSFVPISRNALRVMHYIPREINRDAFLAYRFVATKASQIIIITCTLHVYTRMTIIRSADTEETFRSLTTSESLGKAA